MESVPSLSDFERTIMQKKKKKPRIELLPEKVAGYSFIFYPCSKAIFSSFLKPI
jgi:hypothetical protein